MTREEARRFFEQRQQPYKISRLADIPEGEPISYYKNGDFIDLCAGPHVMRTGNIGAFKLTSVASAYYKGDEKNPQLQRIYGTAFKNKTELEAYFKMLEEAKSRDHRKIGRGDGAVSPSTPTSSAPACRSGCPRARRSSRNWRSWPRKPSSRPATCACKTPHIAKEKMYLTSGHLPYYAESCFRR